MMTQSGAVGASSPRARPNIDPSRRRTIVMRVVNVSPNVADVGTVSDPGVGTDWLELRHYRASPFLRSGPRRIPRDYGWVCVLHGKMSPMRQPCLET